MVMRYTLTKIILINTLLAGYAVAEDCNVSKIYEQFKSMGFVAAIRDKSREESKKITENYKETYDQKTYQNIRYSNGFIFFLKSNPGFSNIISVDEYFSTQAAKIEAQKYLNISSKASETMFHHKKYIIQFLTDVKTEQLSGMKKLKTIFQDCNQIDFDQIWERKTLTKEENFRDIKKEADLMKRFLKSSEKDQKNILESNFRIVKERYGIEQFKDNNTPIDKLHSVDFRLYNLTDKYYKKITLILAEYNTDREKIRLRRHYIDDIKQNSEFSFEYLVSSAADEVVLIAIYETPEESCN